MVLPIVAVTLPASLAGQANGRLSATTLVDTPGRAGGPVVRLVAPAARSWRALEAAATGAGHVLRATSSVDSYRPYSVQECVFVERYQPEPIAGRPRKWWNGEWWYQKYGTAAAAVPGTSNHGLGLAVDVADVDAHLNWLLTHAGTYGWSWELQSEPWHIRYTQGDRIPAAVIAYEEDDMALDPDTLFDIGSSVLNRPISGDPHDAKNKDLAYLAWRETRDGMRELLKRPPVQAAPVDTAALKAVLLDPDVLSALAAELRKSLPATTTVTLSGAGLTVTNQD